MNRWEDSQGFSEYFQALKEVLLEPAKFFSTVDPTGNLNRPLIFALISSVIGGAATLLWGLFLAMIQLVTAMSSQQEIMTNAVVNAATGFMTPVIAIMAAFIGAAITHVCLLLFGSGASGYLGTVRAQLYSIGTYVLMLIPLCGSFVAGIWAIVIYIIGLIVLHKTDTWRVIAAVFLPMILCCCCLAILGFMFGAAIMAAIQQGMGGGGGPII